MKDQRLKVFRSAVEGVIESLDALVRVSRWKEVEAPPEPLRTAVSKLVDRLGTADRLSSGAFLGSPTDVNKVSAMCTAMKRLDAAYVTYRKRVQSAPEQTSDAASALEVEIAETTATSAFWR
ncbi:MAG TPA: hypothetical protein VN894_19475 [Polyangiaceae bacterium]|nr:hypothetical protein [Polyangiaceae bacterium]